MGPDSVFQTGLRQPVWPYTLQLANMFSIELHQEGRTVVGKIIYIRAKLQQRPGATGD